MLEIGVTVGTFSVNMAELVAELDWRIQAATTLAQDLPAAYPGGPSHPAGSAFVLSSMVETPSGKVGFLTPSAVAIALSVSAKAVNRAEELQRTFSTAPTPSPDGTVSLMSGSATGELFDYFEQCFGAGVFAYQAIEAYCNFKVAYNLSGSLTMKRKTGSVSMDRAQIEHLSTSEKLATVLPQILNRPTPKGTAKWERFRELEELRNATVHLKSNHQWGDAAQMEGSPYKFFLCGSPRACFDTAISMIRHFSNDQEGAWLDGALRVLATLP